MSDASANPPEQPVPNDPAPNPQFQKKFEEALASWSDATEAGKAEEAQVTAMELLALCAEEQLNNPDPTVLLMDEADDLESKGDWAKAEAVRRKILVLGESTGDHAIIVKAQRDLCALLRLIGRLDESWQFACATTITARFWKTNIAPLVMALINEAVGFLDRGDSAKALAAASEAVQIIAPGKMHDKLRGRALATRAKCLLAKGDPAAADFDLASAWELLNANNASCLPIGTIAALGNWWEVKSQQEERLGNLPSAREAISAAIEHRRQLEGPHPLASLARALQKLGELSKAAADHPAAERAISEANAIRAALHLPEMVGRDSVEP